jgi:hypothetical protein
MTQLQPLPGFIHDDLRAVRGLICGCQNETALRDRVADEILADNIKQRGQLGCARRLCAYLRRLFAPSIASARRNPVTAGLRTGGNRGLL